MVVCRSFAFGSIQEGIIPAHEPGAQDIGGIVEDFCGIGLFRRRGQLLHRRLVEKVSHFGMGIQQLLDLTAQFGIAAASRVEIGSTLDSGLFFQGREKQGFRGRGVAHDLAP